MVPLPPITIDADTVSGITGAISLICWIIVFAPQIYENFRRKSSEGLSLMFLVLWLAGDVFNVLGAVLQGLFPTMIALAVYYTLADIVLLYQCLLYGGIKLPDLEHMLAANPMGEDVLETVLSRDYSNENNQKPAETRSLFVSFLYKLLMIIIVFLAGLITWYISFLRNGGTKKSPEDLVFDPLAQAFGWSCAFLYLGSRISQILLNYQRKSCEGVSFMFFVFACLGNIMYIISILAVDMSWNYIYINSSWLAGAVGPLFLDTTIFLQFFLYNEADSDSSKYSSKHSSKSQNTEPLLGSHAGYASVN